MTSGQDLIFMSPLAQNFDLAIETARILQATGRRVILGGNMAPLASPADVHMVHRGQLDNNFVQRLVSLAGGIGGLTATPLRLGRVKDQITWSPSYRHLESYSRQVPILRVNASHGCLYKCTFCGDAWSRQLTLVNKSALAAEVEELSYRYPDTRLVYIGDKTFGQSPEAVENLIDIFLPRPEYQFIVQTHVMQITRPVIDAMQRLGVKVVELGFESADTAMLKKMNKVSRGLDDYTERIQSLHEAGFKVILNLMGGLDEETEASHEATIRWLHDSQPLIWLFNLYNFVPYPLTPVFPSIRDKIYDWNFAAWREDAKVVYRPAELTPERSWTLFQQKVAAAHSLITRDVPPSRPVYPGEAGRG